MLIYERDINRYFTVRLTEGVNPTPTLPSNGQLLMIFLVVCLTPDNEHMCTETDFTQEEACPSGYNLQEAGPSI